MSAGKLVPVLCLLAVAAVHVAAPAADWPQWRGAQRDGSTTENISTTWPATEPTSTATGAAASAASNASASAPASASASRPASRPASQPRELWRAYVGVGHSAVSVVDGKAVTLGFTGDGDTVWCLDAATGKELWHFDYPAVSRMKGEPGGGAYDGPHAAPTIHKGLVYTLSRDGKVNCLELATGKPKWARDLHEDLKAKFPECGFSGAPLVVGDMVIVAVGTAGTALDVATGETKWQSGPEIAGYAAPTLCQDAKGRKLLLMFGFSALSAVNPADGKEYWSAPWPIRWGVNVCDPISVAGGLFISSNYGGGCGLVDELTGVVRWKNKAIGSQCSPLVQREGKVYGFDGYIGDLLKNQSLVCVDAATGDECWRQKGMGGQMILAGGDKLVMLLITGELVIAEASPDGYRELARGVVQKAEECPVPPTLAGGRLYLRSGKGRLVCLDVAPPKTPKE